MTAEVLLSKDVANQYIGDMLKMLPGAILYRELWEHQRATSGLCVSLTVRLQYSLRNLCMGTLYRAAID